MTKTNPADERLSDPVAPGRLVFQMTKVDRIDDRGNIREHLTRDGHRTICGLEIGQRQSPCGNATCRRCEKIAARCQITVRAASESKAHEQRDSHHPKDTMKIKCSTFVKRQTAESPFSFLADPIGRTADWRSLEVHVEECMEEPSKLDAIAKDGYRPGVMVLSIPPCFAGFRFYSGVTVLTETTPLRARFAARRPGEAAIVTVEAQGPKTEAVAVDIILYSRALLVEEGEQPAADTDYEIVSINARTSAEPEPMSPMAMARNFLALPGGTKAEYTAVQFAEAIVYWSTRAMHSSE